jgi:hypothetical protein
LIFLVIYLIKVPKVISSKHIAHILLSSGCWGIKQLEREAYNSPPLSDEINNAGALDSILLRFNFLRAVKTSSVVLWVVTPCGLVVVTGVSEEHIASFFRIPYTLEMEAMHPPKRW